MLKALTFIVNGTESEAHPEIVVYILLAIIAFVCTIAPKFIWTFRYGWHYKDAEPSDTTLIVIRVIGILSLILLVCSLVMLYFS